MPSSAKQVFDTIFDYDDSLATYNNRTLEAQSPLGTAFTVLGATADFLYLGSDDRFDMAIFDVNQAGVLGALTWEYWNGSAWTQFQPYSGSLQIDPDGTDFLTDYAFNKDGVEIFPIGRLSGWATTAVNNTTRYWIRVSSQTSVSTAPTIYRIQMRPLAGYCSSKDVYEFMQLSTTDGGTDFTTSSTPTKAQVEDRILMAQSRLEYLSRKYFRPHIAINEGHHFNLGGFKLDKSDPYKILNVEVWDGASWEARSQGRDGDFFLVPDTGMIYFSRYFILPARAQNYTSTTWAWGGGEFMYSVRCTYLYGRNIYTDEAGFAAFDACVKWVAADLISNYDFGEYLIGGGNIIGGQEKAQMWKQEAEEWAESLRTWETF